MSKFNNRRAVPPETLVMHADDTRTAAQALEQEVELRADNSAALGTIRETLERLEQRTPDGTPYALYGLCSPSAARRAVEEQRDREYLAAQRSCHHPNARTRQDHRGYWLRCSDCSAPEAFQPYGPGALQRLRLEPWDPVLGFRWRQEPVHAAQYQDEVSVRVGVMHSRPVSAAQRLAQASNISPYEAQEQLARLCDVPDVTRWCFHPFATCTEYPGRDGEAEFVSRCPDCDMTACAVDAYPELGPGPAVRPVAVPRSRFVPSAQLSAEERPRWGATAGVNVPAHHPESWKTGQPWDTTELPERQDVPARRDPQGREQRLREAADRVRRGVW